MQVEKEVKMTAVKHHGLINQGATCYLNSLLQVLFMTREFREAVQRGTEHLDQHLRDVFDEMQRQTAVTHTVTNKLGISRVWEERDAAQCFEKILTLSSPDASQIFHGQLIHKTTCWKCNTVKQTETHFWHLPLALIDSGSQTYSVVDGIEEYFRDCHFSGLDQMYCEACDEKVDATVKCEVKRHPDVLVLLLKRFDFDYCYMTYVKNNGAVKVPFTLHIQNQTYELYAVVDHVGDLQGGHYTATIKNQEEGQWYNFNDERVTKTRPVQLEKSKTSYLLYYKKRQKISAAQKQCVPIKAKNKRRGVRKTTSLLRCVRCVLFCLFIMLIIVIVCRV